MKNWGPINHWLHVWFSVWSWALYTRYPPGAGARARTAAPPPRGRPPPAAAPRGGSAPRSSPRPPPAPAANQSWAPRHSPPITAHLVRPVVLGLGVDEAGGVLVEGGHQLAQAAALQTSANVRNKCKHKTGFRSILITPSLCRCLDFIPSRRLEEWSPLSEVLKFRPQL